MYAQIKSVVDEFILEQKLPNNFHQQVERYYLPLAEKILRRVSASNTAPILGINGAQGSGKSTLAALLVPLLRALAGIRVVSLSIDDFYLSQDARKKLSQEVHPLLATRGVPGTHEVDLAMNTLKSLRLEGSVCLPAFDKAEDDRIPEYQWQHILAPVDLIILEGWCLGVTPEDESALVTPLNLLEANEDPQGHWRRYVNEALSKDYAQWFGMVDFWLFLKIPDFSFVQRWRWQQEAKLRERLQQEGKSLGKTLSPGSLERFIQHYERLTLQSLLVLPHRAEVVFKLNENQQIVSASGLD